MSARTVSRRAFLQAGAAGAGLVLAVSFVAGCRKDEGPPATDAPFAPDAWIRIRPDGSVTVMVDRAEMGQGVSTALPMLVAEELDADWASVRFEAAPAHKAYGNPLMQGMQATGGSTSIRAAWRPLREAGARARLMLVRAAAGQWGVDPSSCRTEPGVVVHEASGRRASYGDLAAAAGKLPVPDAVALKEPGAFRLIGKPVPRLDSPAIMRGAPVFTGDVRVPGMLVAVLARCPSFGGSAKGFSDVKARAVPGVRHVVQVSNGIAVVADDYWAARRGRDALEVTWDPGPVKGLDSAAIAARFRELAATEDADVVRNDGDAGTALRGAAKAIEATYELPYLAHATMEPMTCAAHVEADRCTVWAPTQVTWAPAMQGGGAHGLAAKLAGVDPARVTIHTMQLGGGFGRRGEMDFIADAVETSKAVGAPVRVVWPREDDIRHDFYRPASHHVLRGGLDAQGRPVAWTHRMVSPSILDRLLPGWIPDWVLTRMGIYKGGADPTAVEGAYDHPYAVPHVRVTSVKAELPVPVGFWRSVGHSTNAFVVESFVDELAHLAGKDPYEFRRDLLAGHPRHRTVLDLAAARAGWGTPLPAGRARGIAVHESFGGWVAQVAEVSLDADRVPRVHRVVVAADVGLVVHPDIVAQQLEGAVVYGLTAALHGEVTIKDGGAGESNFHDYPMLRMDRAPVVEVHLVPSAEPPGGVGEVGTPPIAPAVANAVFALTGTRVRRLPIRGL